MKVWLQACMWLMWMTARLPERCRDLFQNYNNHTIFSLHMIFKF